MQRFVADVRAANLAAIRGCVERAVQLGELSPERNAAALAVALNGFLVGISAQARDGVDRATLQASIAEIMSMWPAGSDHVWRSPQAGAREAALEGEFRQGPTRARRLSRP